LKSDWTLPLPGKTIQPNLSAHQHGKAFPFLSATPNVNKSKTTVENEEGQKVVEMFIQELLRRGSEILSLAVIGGILFRNSQSIESNKYYRGVYDMCLSKLLTNIKLQKLSF